MSPNLQTRQAEAGRLVPAGVPFLDLASLHEEIQAQLNAAWAAIVADSAFIGGVEVERFEGDWARYCGAAHAVGVGNGTDALLLTLRALGIGPGAEVIVPANTFIATAEAVVLAGAVPRFIDVDPATLLTTPQAVADAVTPRTAAVIVVHLFGHVPDAEGIRDVADRHGLAVVEDAAQAHGAMRAGRRVGTFGHASCFSFYPGKNLGALGDAGAVVTDSADIAARVRTMANHGRQARATHHHHELLGTNSRLDGLQAAMLRIKLAFLDGWNERRRRAAARYRQQLERSSTPPIVELADSRGVDHLFVVRAPDRDATRRALEARGIATGIHYPVPCHRQPPMVPFATGPLAAAESAAGEILSLPMFPHITDEQVDRVCRALEEVAPR